MKKYQTVNVYQLVGDCDSDSDCIDDLRCFQRLDYEPVPGCVGLGSRR